MFTVIERWLFKKIQGVNMKSILLLVLLCLTFSTKADFFQALDDYESGKFAKAYDQFLDMASVGDKRAQFNLGVMHYQGQHVKANTGVAYAWIKLANDSDIKNAEYSETLKLVENQLTDKESAESKYQQLVNQYSTEALIETLYPELISISGESSFNATPKTIVNPRYPKKAAIKGIVGYTRFSFDLDNKGVPRNIYLTESFPQGVFDKESIKAIYKWRFEPKTNQQNKAIAQENLKYTIQFNLVGSNGTELKEGVYEKQLELAQKGSARAQFLIGYFEKKLNVSKGAENPNSWFLKSALQGQPEAQFELGQSLIYGQGCLQDQSKGVEWLARAANNGEKRAKMLLASNSSRINTLESQLQSLSYTKDIEELTPRTIIDLAWMFATSPFKQIRNPDKAFELLDKLPRNSFKDDITIYEIEAAAYAAKATYKKAISLQEDALDKAEDLSADSTIIKTRLASYKKQTTWF